MDEVFPSDNIFSSFRAVDRRGISHPRFAPRVIHFVPLIVVLLLSPFRVPDSVACPGLMGFKRDLTDPFRRKFCLLLNNQNYLLGF
jgi:hypothetical protein